MASQSSEKPSAMPIMNSTFQFQIDYSKSKCIPAGQCICSPIFAACDHKWSLSLYPLGRNQRTHVSLYLFLECKTKETNVECTFQVLDKKGKFITIGNSGIVKLSVLRPTYCTWGQEKFIDRDTIEKLYCVNSVLVVSYSIRLLHENSCPLTEPKMAQSYPGGLCEHIERLWDKGKRFDVAFEVEGQSISAHRLMLAARSPVFEAELFSSMAESKMERIKIDEMKTAVFKALLHFIYTDELAKEGSNDHESRSVEFFQGLFVAADRYGLDKLTLMCEDQLEMNLSVDTVVSTLLLADRYSCAGLKKKCLDFASCPENFSLLAVREEYLNGMLGAPPLLAESEMVKCASIVAKKQRTG